MSRIEKINELIKQELGNIILREVEFSPGCLVTITRVETSEDLRHAKIFISVLPETEEKENFRILRENAGGLQAILNKRLVLKYVPRIEFKIDELSKKVQEVEELLDKVSKKS